MSAARNKVEELDIEGDKIRFLNSEQGYELLDRQARRYFGMSGREFIRAWRSGDLDEHLNQSDVTYVAMLIPFADED